MSLQLKGLLVGGLLPALLFGIAGLLQKSSVKAGVGLGPYLLCIGLGVLAVGLLWTATDGDHTLNLRSGILAVLLGLSWSLGAVLVMVGLSRFDVPLAKLVPLYNLNTLVVVLLALVVFAEARDIAVARLLIGALLMFLGAALVVRA